MPGDTAPVEEFGIRNPVPQHARCEGARDVVANRVPRNAGSVLVIFEKPRWAALLATLNPNARTSLASAAIR
jgi:hypothetical protein